MNDINNMYSLSLETRFTTRENQQVITT